MCTPALPYVAACLPVAPRLPERRCRSGACGRDGSDLPLLGCLSGGVAPAPSVPSGRAVGPHNTWRCCAHSAILLQRGVRWRDTSRMFPSSRPGGVAQGDESPVPEGRARARGIRATIREAAMGTEPPHRHHRDNSYRMRRHTELSKAIHPVGAHESGEVVDSDASRHG